MIESLFDVAMETSKFGGESTVSFVGVPEIFTSICSDKEKLKALRNKSSYSINTSLERTVFAFLLPKHILRMQ